MKNLIGHEIPEQVAAELGLGIYGVDVDPRVAEKDPTPLPEREKKNNKIVASIEEAVKLCGLKDGMTISFHHHFRNGDQVGQILRRHPLVHFHFLHDNRDHRHPAKAGKPNFHKCRKQSEINHALCPPFAFFTALTESANMIPATIISTLLMSVKTHSTNATAQIGTAIFFRNASFPRDSAALPMIGTTAQRIPRRAA